MRKSLASVAVVVATLASALLPATAAAGASLTVEDATGDTWMTDYGDGTTAPKDVSAGSQVNVDLEKTLIRYAHGKVTVKATFVDLRKSTNRFVLGLRLRTNEGVKRLAAVETIERETWAGDHHLARFDGDELSCRGLAHEIDYAADTVELVVPASCLSKPRWVQATIGVDGYAATAGQPFMTHDNGVNDGWQHGGWTARVRQG